MNGHFSCCVSIRYSCKYIILPIVSIAAKLILTSCAANSQCPQGLPLFGDRDPHNELPDNIQAILPTYTFTCSGPVVQWGACVQPQGPPERYDIYFQVWRLTGEDGCYSIVGSNRIADGDPNVPRGCIIFDVPQEQRIMVEAGDVMGFYSDHNRDNGGIEVDTAVNLDVWYRTLSNPTLSNLEDSSLCIGATGDLNTFSDSGAPVITAMVGKYFIVHYPVPIPFATILHIFVITKNIIRSTIWQAFLYAIVVAATEVE